MIGSRGRELRPVVMVWDGNDPLTVSEMMWKDELIALYGMSNLHQFQDCDSAEEFLRRHRGLSKINPAVIVIYSGSNQVPVSEFFESIKDISQKKILVRVCDRCPEPTREMFQDSFVTLSKLTNNIGPGEDALDTEILYLESPIRRYLLDTVGEPAQHRLEPAKYLSQSSGH